MKTLDPHAIPLDSINLIEASAGTGKSWTVTLLYLRLILEKQFTVDQILVVTFTEAATKELRDAVRNRLVAALEFFENPESDALEEYKKLYQSYACDDQALTESISRLRRAKLSIDEAAIFTIHSFCKRVLNEYAFESSLPFESELMDNDRELMQRLTDDFWRRSFYKAPRTLLYKLQQKSITPDSLLEDIHKHVGKPYLEIKEPVSQKIKDKEWQEVEALFETATEIWRQNSDEITSLLIDHGHLNKQTHSVDKLHLLCQTMSDCSESLSRFTDQGKGLEKLGEALLEAKTNKGFEPPKHPFFSQWQVFLEAWENINTRSDDFINRIRINLLSYLQINLPKEKKRIGKLAYDDLLLQLQAALNSNEELAEHLREKYRAALIDEFQDTDPVQYDIFTRIYNDSETKENVVFLVGDPKQAIYSFRGGDIHTYLKAKKNTLEQNHYTLKTNYRSHPKLIAAYNTLYIRCENPFQDKGIEYVQIEAGKKDLSDIELGSPLQFWQTYQEDGEGSDGIKIRIADAVAGDITQILNNKTLLEERPVSGGDFAILVKSHKQGDLIKQALNRRGIASIQSSKKTIFETHEAEEMFQLLSAIIEPQREDVIRRALVTELMGNKADDLLQYQVDANLWEMHLVNFQNWHFQWKKQGFLPMMRNLMQETKMHQQLLSFDDGERRLTNVLHLSELIHQVLRQQSLGMEELLRWLNNQQEIASNKEGELRLESDDNLVKIVTIHKSKGLEYPFVYCPFVGLAGEPKVDKVFSFHHHDKSYLEMGSPDLNTHKTIKKEQEKAEQTRLLYVALTRAKYRCTVVCFPEPIKRNPDKSALGWLLTNGMRTLSGSKKEIKENNTLYYQVYASALEKLSIGNPQISASNLPVFNGLRYDIVAAENDPVAREFTAEIKPQAQVTSFSGLTAGSHGWQHEVPDYDVSVSDIVSVGLNNTKQKDEFPRGATAGTVLHEIYENLDFEVPLNEQQELIGKSLSKWGFDKKHIKAANTLIENSLQAEIFEGFTLGHLSKEKRLDEMEFYLPLERLDVNALKQILHEHLPQDWQVVRDAFNTLNFDEVEGFLKGYIDLIFEHRGKYYIVDYKSNSLDDYAPDNLLPIMAESHYYLQYLLYSVALHRYLQKRLADYSWETHMGGAYYLFIRGMHKTTEKGGGVLRQDSAELLLNGVFSSKPTLELITALDGLFMKSFL